MKQMMMMIASSNFFLVSVAAAAAAVDAAMDVVVVLAVVVVVAAVVLAHGLNDLTKRIEVFLESIDRKLIYDNWDRCVLIERGYHCELAVGGYCCCCCYSFLYYYCCISGCGAAQQWLQKMIQNHGIRCLVQSDLHLQ